MELREAINKLFEMTDEQRFEIFGYKDAKNVLDNYEMDMILREIRKFYSKPKYGDVYENKNDEDKCVFLGEDCGDKYWLLFDEYLPQEYSKSNFERYYVKTGKNVEDRLKNLFK